MPAEDIVFGLFSRDDIMSADGDVIIQANSLMDVLTTDSSGTATSTSDIPFGAYYVKELSLTENLISSNLEYDLLLEYGDDVTPVITVFANEGKAIENFLIKGQIKVIKTDGDTKTPLEGVVFEVFDSTDTVVATLVTDKDGIAFSDWLSYGSYTVKEKTAKTGYILDDSVYEIEIKDHEKVYELSLQNKKIPKGKPDNPKTGENFAYVIWIVLIILAAGGLTGIGVAHYGKRKKATGK
jgi:uncharacterized surface anchored protein